MKFSVLSLLLVLTVGYDPNPRFTLQVAPNQEFTLKIGEKVLIEGGIPLANLKLKFVSVPRYARCPEGAQCILPGNAKVELKFKSSNRESLSVILNTDEAPQQVEVPGWRVTLTRLSPHPKVGGEIDPSEYEAAFVVSGTSFLRTDEARTQ